MRRRELLRLARVILICCSMFFPRWISAVFVRRSMAWNFARATSYRCRCSSRAWLRRTRKAQAMVRKLPSCLHRVMCRESLRRLRVSIQVVLRRRSICSSRWRRAMPRSSRRACGACPTCRRCCRGSRNRASHGCSSARPMRSRPGPSHFPNMNQSALPKTGRVGSRRILPRRFMPCASV